MMSRVLLIFAAVLMTLIAITSSQPVDDQPEFNVDDFTVHINIQNDVWCFDEGIIQVGRFIGPGVAFL